MPIRTAVRGARMRLVAATLACATACGLAASLPAPATAAAPGLDAEEQALRTQINALRAEHGLRALRISAPLTRAADWMSLDMASYNYFDHRQPRPPLRTAHPRVRLPGREGREPRGRSRRRGRDVQAA